MGNRVIIQNTFFKSIFLAPIIFNLLSCSPPTSHENVRIFEEISDEVTADNYLNGEAFCKRYSKELKSEQGFRVDVPVDHNNPGGSKTSIYAFFAKKLDKNKPTMVYFDGGPGQTSHGMPYFVDGFNQLHFDQRGLGCSAPKNYDLYKDENFYSSENTAKDLKIILDKMGIKKVSVYAISYGTVPATIFSSLYPKMVKSLSLEGVMYSGEYVFTAELLQNKMQKLYDSLSSRTKNGLDKIAKTQPLLFTKIVQQLAYKDKGLASAKALLELSVNEDGTFDQEILNNAIKPKDSRSYALPQNPLAIDRNLHATLFCKEFKLAAFNKDLVLINKQVVLYERQSDAEDYCHDMGVQNINSNPYEASNYPVQVPVYYFQGTDDGATIATGGIKHWRTVPQDKSYLLLHKKGGHNTNIENIFSENLDISLSQQIVFQKAIRDLGIIDKDIEQLNFKQDRSEVDSWYLYTEQKNAQKQKLSPEDIAAAKTTKVQIQ